MEILFLKPDLVTVELNTDTCYYAKERYEVFLNGKSVHHDERNVFTLDDLESETEYQLEVVFISGDKSSLSFKTPKAIFVDFVAQYHDGKSDDTASLQKAIEALKEGEILRIRPGRYKIVSVFLKDHTTIELQKGATLVGETHREAFPIFKKEDFVDYRDMRIPLGTWEGRNEDSYTSLFTTVGVKDVCIYGLGTIDENAEDSDFWINHRVKRIAFRPKGLFFHSTEGLILQGITLKNTPSWSIHPFFSSDLKFIDIKVINPWDSPNTDGLDPESSSDILIAGCLFSVGDDCIAIKSGKEEFGKTYRTPSKNIVIRNCLMEYGHGGVTLGSENSGGISNVSVSSCLFRHTDRGLRIKSQRGRGNYALIKEINFDNILMDNVKAPFIINAFYKAGNDEPDDYRYQRVLREVDERTPVFGSFTFKNIRATDVEWTAGYFLGLPESSLKKITLSNISISYKSDAVAGEAIMTRNSPQLLKRGFIFENVDEVALHNIDIDGLEGEKFEYITPTRMEVD